MDENRRRERWLGPLLLFLIAAGCYWKLTLTNQYTWLNSPDLVNMTLPMYQFESSEIQNGRVPLWDPHQWGGQPVVGQLQFGLQYPVNWLLFLVPLHRGYIRSGAMNWYFVVIHYMAMLFCYLLCRDLNRSFAASVLAGSAFGLSGYIGATAWPQVLNGAVWGPLVFLFLMRVLRGERPLRNAAFAGAMAGLSFLGGHHQMPFYFTLAAGALWLYHWISGPRSAIWRGVAAAAVFGVFLLLVSGLQTLPAAEYGRLAVRWINSAHDPVSWDQTVPYSVHAQFSLAPSSLPGIVLPGLDSRSGPLLNSNPYIGIVIFSLGLFGAATFWKNRMTRLFAALALGGLLYALGQYVVFHGVLYALVPLVEKGRETSRAVVLFHIGIVVLAAYGLDALRDPAIRQRDRFLVRGLLGFGGLIWLLVLVLSMIRIERAVNFDWFAMTGLIALLLAGAVHALRAGLVSDRHAAVLVTLLLLLEAGLFATSGMAARETGWALLDKLRENADIVSFLRTRPGPVRVEKDDRAVPYNFGDWHGLDGFETFLASMTTNVFRVEGEFNSRMLWGVNYYIGLTPRRPDQAEVFAGASGLKVYSNPQAFPRVWTVHQAERIGEKEVVAKLFPSLAELRNRTLLLENPPALENCAGPEKATLASRDSNGLVIDVEMQCRGMVIAGETFFPGWEARVDGRKSRIYEAYAALRGVVVDKGRHRIEMRYRPRLVYYGAAMTFIGLAGAFVLAVSIPRRAASKMNERPV